MLRAVRAWLDRTFAAKPPPTPEEARRAADQARSDRAETILDLRAEVRRLQQAIKDASDALDRGVADHERAIVAGRLAALGQQLEQKQAELGKLQGRV